MKKKKGNVCPEKGTYRKNSAGKGIRTAKKRLRRLAAGFACMGLLLQSLAAAGNLPAGPGIWPAVTGLQVLAAEPQSVSVSILHQHAGDDQNGGGCYQEIYHQHSSDEGCYDSGTCTVTVQGYGGFWTGDLDRWCTCHGTTHTAYQKVIRKHSSCGQGSVDGLMTFQEYHGPGTSGFTGYDTTTHSYEKLVCERENEVIGYELGCGQEDGSEVAVLTVTPASDGWTRNLVLHASYEVKGNVTIPDEAFIWNGGTPTSQADLTVSGNGTYTCRLNAGTDNNSEAAVVSLTVSNVDGTGPEILSLDYSQSWTNGNVTVTVQAQDVQPDGSSGSGLAEQAYSFDGGNTWQGNSYTYTENGTYTVLVRDTLGNTSEKSVIISSIDRTAPRLEVSIDKNANVKKNTIQLSAQDLQPDGGAGSGLAAEPWSFDGGTTWGTVSAKDITENGTVTVAVRDALGNIAKTELVISNIDSTAPEFTLSLSDEEWTQSTDIIVDATDKNDAGMSGSGVAEYSYDGGQTWIADSRYTIAENGVWRVKVRDALGNTSGVKTIAVSKVDTTVPEVTVKYNPYTSAEIRIQIEASDQQPDGSEGSGLADKPYSYDGGQTWTDSNTFWVDQNGDYEIWVQDQAGNIYKETVKVSNMDHTGPAITVSKTPVDGEWTTGNVSVQVTAADKRDDGTSGIGLAENPWSFDEGANWGQQTDLEFEQNGTYPVWVRDQYGNITKEEITISNIDVTAPKIEKITYTSGKNLQRVQLEVKAVDEQPDGSEGSGLAEKPYSFDGGETWQADRGYTATSNGTLNILVRDRMGNVAEKRFSISNIDEYPPDLENMQVTADPDGWTTEQVLLTFTAEDKNPDGSDGAGLAEEAWSFDGGETWQKENQCIVTENGTWTVLVRDVFGNTAEKEFTVSNIDRTGPSVTLTQEPAVWLAGDATVKVEAEDLAGTVSGSGLAGQPFSTDGENWSSESEYQISKPGTFTIYVRDAMGNVTEATINVKRVSTTGGQQTGGSSGNGGSGSSGSSSSGSISGSGGTGSGSSSDTDGTSGSTAGDGISGVDGDLNGNGIPDSEENLDGLPILPGDEQADGSDADADSDADNGSNTDANSDSRLKHLSGENSTSGKNGKNNGPSDPNSTAANTDTALDGSTLNPEDCICEDQCTEGHENTDCPVCGLNGSLCSPGSARKGVAGAMAAVWNKIPLPVRIIGTTAVGAAGLMAAAVLLALGIFLEVNEQDRRRFAGIKRIRRENDSRWIAVSQTQKEKNRTGEFLLWSGLWGRLHAGQILEVRVDGETVSEAIISASTGIRL